MEISYFKNKKPDKKIDIDKYLKIYKYVDEYTDITNGRIDLFNNIGSILNKATDEIQNAAYIVNDLKYKENVDIKTLKTMHGTLEKVLKEWIKTISSTFRNVKFSEYDMRPPRPSNKKDRKKPRPSNRKARKSKKSDTDKDVKPDTDKDIKPDKKFLLEIIRNNIKILNRINTNLSKSLENVYPDKNKELFNGLCSLNKCYINPLFKILVSSIYAVNVSIESLQKGMMSKLDIRYIDYDSLRKNILSRQVRSRLENKIYDTELKIRIAVKEIEMINTLISTNIKKYLLMLNSSDKMSYYEIDQLCFSTDKTVGYMRRIVLTIPDIIDKTYKSCNQKYCENVIKLRYLNEEYHHINKIQLDLMSLLFTEYNEMSDIQYEKIVHKNIRFDFHGRRY